MQVDFVHNVMQRVSAMKPLQRYFVTLCTIATPLLVWLFYWYTPLQATIAHDRVLLHTSEQQQLMRGDVQRSIKTAQEHIVSLEQELHKFGTQNNVCMHNIIQSAQAAHVELLKGDMVDAAGHNSYGQQGIAAQLKGTLDGVINFLQHLTHNHPLLTVRSIDLQHNMQTQEWELTFNVSCASGRNI